jgi:ribonucleoside-diphosphate reductase alpha chain
MAGGDAKGATLELVGESCRPIYPAGLRTARCGYLDRSRDALLTDFGKTTLEDRYLLPGESYQDMFARVATAYADDADHAQRVYDYISKLWFMPATPVLSNGGTGRGLPISCFLNSVDDSLEGIVGTWNENVWLASAAAASAPTGAASAHRREGRPQRQDQRHHPLRPRDGQPDAGDQPGLAAPRLGGRLPRHPPPGDRGVPRDPQALGRLQPQGAEPAPRHLVTDEFMEAVRDGAEFGCARPRPASGRKVDARALAEAPRDPPADRRALPDLHRHGEPGDAQASARPGPQGAPVEPLLGDHAATGKDHLGRRPHRGLLPLVAQPRDLGRVARTPEFIEDVMRFLDNVLQDFIDRAPPRWRAVYGHARALVGLGVMGFHSFLQARSMPFESAMAKSWNMRSSSTSAARSTQASMMLAGRARPLPRRRRHGRDGALQLQDGDRADRLDLDHLRRHLAPASSRSRPTSTPTRRCRAPSRSRTRTSRSCSRRRAKNTTRCGTRSSSTAARSSTSTS